MRSSARGGIPSLGVGLHLTLLNGRPVLPPERIHALVGPDGRFFDDAVSFGVALFTSPELRRQANAEIEAQFERFHATGLVMDHINGHRHFHLHPVVLEAIARIAPRFGSSSSASAARAFRCILPGKSRSRDRALFRLAVLFSANAPHSARVDRWRRLAANDHVFGLYDSGAMTEDRLLRLLDHLPEGVSEIYCHPATRRWKGPDNLPASYQPEAELRALLSAAVKTKMDAMGMRPLSYRAALS